MNRKYFLAIPVLLIVGLIPYLVHFHTVSGEVKQIGAGRLGRGVLQVEEKYGFNFSMYYLNVTLENTGSSVSICYANIQQNVVPFNEIFVFSSNHYFGDTIPTGEGNYTIVFNYTLEEGDVISLYLSNGELLTLNYT